MASRPAFLTHDCRAPLVRIETFDFKWHPGLALIQKMKSVEELHSAISKKYPGKKILEVSTKSKDVYGKFLSAFNLTFITKRYPKSISVETAFQSSKVFDNGGPYIDLLEKTSLEAKKDLRIKNSGKLTHFLFFQEHWELTPLTAFYDWLYINALNQHKNLVEYVTQYDCFTDIEFNPEKSINCQAHSVALFVSLYKKDALKDALISKANYLNTIANFNIPERLHTTEKRFSLVQGSLL